MPFLIELWRPFDTAMGYLSSPWFFGFAVGAAVFGLWDPVSSLITKAKEAKLLHPSLKPTKGLHPAIISFRPNDAGEVIRSENYGVERWFFYPSGQRVLIALFFERLTGTNQIEITNIAGQKIHFKMISCDNKLLIAEFSKRILLEGVKIVCYEISGTSVLTRLESVRPQLHASTATEKRQ